MNRFVLIVMLMASGLAAQESTEPAADPAKTTPAEKTEPAAPAENPAPAESDGLEQPIHEMGLGLDPTRLQTFVGGSFSYVNRASEATAMTLRGDAMYRFSFMDDNRAWWAVNGGLPFTMYNGGKWGKNASGIGDVNIGVRRIIPGSFRQVIFLDASWGLTKTYGLTSGQPFPPAVEGMRNRGHNTLTPGWGFSTPLNATMQLLGTVSYTLDLGRQSYTEGQKISLLEVKPMLLWGLANDWILRGDFTVGYSLVDQVKPGFGLIPVADSKIRLIPAVTAGHLMGEERNVMLYGTLEFPLDKWSIAHREQYLIKFGANYYLR